jgi:transposase InsO family protein
MQLHANAKLGPAGRIALVDLVVSGQTFRAAAAALNVSPATAHRWWRRYTTALTDKATPCWFADRSSRPHRCPSQTSVELEQVVVEDRLRTGHGPRLIAGRTGVAHSTVHAILRRAGCSRAPRAERQATVRYEWPCPGDLLHMDVKRYPRFARPGHAVTGDRTKTRQQRIAPMGHDYFHAIVDDHTRLVYGELLSDERSPTVTAFFERALAWFATHNITARRLMTDGAWAYTRNASLSELLTHHEIRHIVTPPYTPRWNGKVERFHQTIEREWAKGLRYQHHHARNQALPHWLEHYNNHRPHSGIGNRPPISRVHNLTGQNN